MGALRTNVLLVEDDVALRTLFSIILARSGYAVRSAEDGFAALVEMRRDVPDILLSDLYMEGMSGFELLSVVRRRFPGIQVVAMSSAYSGVAVPDGIAADAFYAKGANPGALLDIVADVKELLSGAPSRENSGLVPVWLARDTADGVKERFVLLSCTECLRGFAQVAANGALKVHSAECVYCGQPIRYAFV
ncbi:response regulator [Granulicella tundricola]|uniref:Response regulator receiver protein n=1 Tax=Granulicella tundricola (strain ATCC BAA-1859 / DSM 23138 / MP5ACTX9) TaxID=1198114 RepID=E8X000_GRATM|nr:response regulator [Granulicella tundricola]ADW68896.1 response regulator receiver protein [Granulicella tundricola MP5ACTX9]